MPETASGAIGDGWTWTLVRIRAVDEALPAPGARLLDVALAVRNTETVRRLSHLTERRTQRG